MTFSVCLSPLISAVVLAGPPLFLIWAELQGLARNWLSLMSSGLNRAVWTVWDVLKSHRAQKTSDTWHIFCDIFSMGTNLSRLLFQIFKFMILTRTCCTLQDLYSTGTGLAYSHKYICKANCLLSLLTWVQWDQLIKAFRSRSRSKLENVSSLPFLQLAPSIPVDHLPDQKQST